jgi:hypothetical protein
VSDTEDREYRVRYGRLCADAECGRCGYDLDATNAEGGRVGILRATQMLNTVLVWIMARNRMEELEPIHGEVVVVTKEMISRVGILAAIIKALIGYFVEKRSVQEGVGVGRPT